MATGSITQPLIPLPRGGITQDHPAWSERSLVEQASQLTQPAPTPTLPDIVSGTFTAPGSSVAFVPITMSVGIYLDPNGFTGTVALERSINNGVDWYPINAAGIQLYKWTFTGSDQPISEYAPAPVTGEEIYRLTCVSRSSGSLDYTFSSEQFGPSISVNPVTLITGDITNTQPIDIRSQGRTGSRVRSYFDDYYNRVHIVPATIDFGAVADSTERTATMWNARLTSNTLSALPGSQDNVVIVGTSTTLKPLARLSVIVHVNADGPPSIDARFTFSFSLGDQVSLGVIGTRARLWPFKPNWAAGVDVQIGYRTDIITSRSGREQRRALRAKHRRQLSYTVTVEGDERRQFTQLVSKWQGRPMLVGDPTRKVVLPTGSPAFAGVAAISETPEWLIVGRQILIDDTHIAVVTGVGELLTFEPSNPAALPAGTIVRPALTASLSGSVGAGHPVSRVAQARINFTVEPGSEAAEEGETGLYIHGGREVFMQRPNWGDIVDQSFEHPVEQVDFGHGRVRTYQPVAMGWFTQSASFVGVGASEVANIETFFHRMRGRRGEFLMPTGTSDFEMADRAVANTKFLRVTGTDIYDNYRDDPRYRSFMVRMRDGRALIRSVSGMSLLGNDTVIEIPTNWFFDFDPSEVAMISWLPVFRFASDDLTFEWPTSHVAQVKLTMRSLENLPAERPIAGLNEDALWVLESWGENVAGLDGLDWAINVRYPAVFWYALPWVMVHTAAVDSFDYLVNVEIPESIG